MGAVEMEALSSPHFAAPFIVGCLSYLDQILARLDELKGVRQVG